MWGKVLTGVAVGVGAVAAAPFTGGGSLLGGASLIGSLTGATAVAAATGAGLTGAAVGGVLAESEKDEKRKDRDKARKEGETKAKAEMSVKLKNLEEKLTLAAKQLHCQEKTFQMLIALEAVAVSCASCDIDFSDKEKQEIGEFVSGMLGANIPENVKHKIKTIYDNPPSIKEAFNLAKNTGVELSMYEDLIQFVMEIDGINEEERVFVQAWNQLKAA